MAEETERNAWDFTPNHPDSNVIEEEINETAITEETPEVVAEVKAVDTVTDTANDTAIEAKADFDLKAFLAEKTGGKYEDIESLLAATEKKAEIDLEGDSAKIYQYLKEGKEAELAEYLTLKNTDFAKMNPQDLLRAHLENTKPHLSENDIDDLLVDRFGFGKEPLTEEDKALMEPKEIAAYEKELRADAISRKEAIADAIKYFDTQKGELSLPDLPKEKIEGLEEYQAWKETQAQSDQEADAYSKEWVNNIEQTVPTIKELPLTLEVETSIGKIALDTVFHLNEERLNQVKEYLKGYKGGTEYDEKMFVKEGKIDFSGLTNSAIERLFSKEIREAQLKDFAAKYEELSLKELKRFDDGSGASSAEPYNAGISDMDRLLNSIPNFN